MHFLSVKVAAKMRNGNSIRPVIRLKGGGGNIPKLNFSGNFPNTIRNNILKLPVLPARAFFIIQDGRQNLKTAISRLVINMPITLLFKCLHVHLLP